MISDFVPVRVAPMDEGHGTNLRRCSKTTPDLDYMELSGIIDS